MRALFEEYNDIEKQIDEDRLLTLDLVSLNDDDQVHYAIDDGYSRYLQGLLDAKANPNALDEFGQSALKRVVEMGHMPMTRVLVCAKANVNDERHYHSILYYACTVSDPITKLLLYNGAVPTPSELSKYSDYPSRMKKAYFAMRARVSNCRAVVIWLLAFRFPGPRDCHVDWIKRMVWSTRHKEYWAPEQKMPPEFDDED